MVGDAAARAQSLVARAGSVASSVGTTVHGRLRPAPAPPGLRAVRDA
jgi:UDP-glucose 4-epimerase